MLEPGKVYIYEPSGLEVVHGDNATIPPRPGYAHVRILHKDGTMGCLFDARESLLKLKTPDPASAMSDGEKRAVESLNGMHDAEQRARRTLDDINSGRIIQRPGPVPGTEVHIVNPVAAMLEGIRPGAVVTIRIELPGKDS